MSLRILLKKKYQGARTNLRGVFDLTIFFVMQLVSKAEKDSVKEKKKEERKEVTQLKIYCVFMTN